MAAHTAKPVERPSTTWVIHIKDFRFQPAQLTVAVGDLVIWINDDGFRHSAFANDGAWGTRELDRGQRAPWRPENPGRYPYHCSAHPTMLGVLTVAALPKE